MLRFSAVILTALSFVFPAIGHSQTTPVWFTLNAQEGQTVTATGSITLRYGQVASTCAVAMSTGPCSAGAGTPTPEAWTSQQTFNATSSTATISIVVGTAAFGNVDPLPGVYKTVQVQEQAVPQNITVNGQSVTVPALSSSSASSATTWFTLNAKEGQTVTATGSITLRYGQVASTCAVAMSTGPCSAGAGAPSPEAWTSQQTFNATSSTATVSIVVGTAAFGNVDPLPGVYKTVQVQEQAVPQSITVDGQSVTVPALSSSSAPSAPSAPTWFTLNAKDGQTVASTGAITLRYGQVASTCAVAMSTGPCSAGAGAPSPEAWTSQQTFNASSTPTVSVLIAPSSFGNVDPLPGVYKTVQVQEQAVPQTVAVNGQSVTVPALSSSYACQLTGTPTSIAFSNTTVGYMISSSGSIKSNCTSTITIDSIQSPAAPFSTSGFQTPFSLAPGQTQSYTAVFSPTATGTATGSITFASTVSSVQPLTVGLTGTGVASTQGTLSSSPAKLSFGNVTVNTTGSQTATITNTGAAAVTVSAVGVTGTGFTLNKVTTPITIGVNQSVQLTIGFTPTTTGSAPGTLTITSNASNGTLAVPLTGTGVTHSVSLSWTNTAAQIAGYNMYRSTVSGGPYSKINPTLITTTNYSDSSVASGTTYYYTVTAVGTNGTESGYSSPTTATVP
jgi:Abnormal spindle-like microcephaly-assoc'd, ASPM-SPD-2-Hydin